MHTGRKVKEGSCIFFTIAFLEEWDCILVTSSKVIIACSISIDFPVLYLKCKIPKYTYMYDLFIFSDLHLNTKLESKLVIDSLLQNWALFSFSCLVTLSKKEANFLIDLITETLRKSPFIILYCVDSH